MVINSLHFLKDRKIYFPKKINEDLKLKSEVVTKYKNMFKMMPRELLEIMLKVIY